MLSFQTMISPGFFRLKSALKLTAFLTLFFFAAASLGWAQPVQKPSAEVSVFKLPSKIEIPETLGTAQSFDLSSSDKPLVLYIQDAHAVSDAQENIQKLISHFQSVYPVSKVLLEGLSGKMDTVLARTFPDAFLREKVMRRYFAKGEMTGAEMAAVFSSGAVSYEGLEDAALYEENARAYAEASAVKPQADHEIQSRETALKKDADITDSPEQKKLNTLIAHFDAGSERFPELLRDLAGFRNEAAKYPRLDLLLKAAAGDNPEDLKKAELGLEKLAESFRAKQLGRLSADHQKMFQEQFQAFRTHRLDPAAFLKTLMELAGPLGVKPRLTPELQALLNKNELLSSLQGGEVFEEIESFIRDLEDKNANTPESRKRLEQIRVLRLLKKLSVLELTRRQWETLSSKHPELLKQDMWKPAARFYETALKRDSMFHEKLKRAGQDQPVIVAVAGGFHAQGFETFLKDNHYPYVSILPSVRSLAGQEHYEALMRGKVSWAEEVRTSLYDGFMRHLSKQLTAALNPSERSLRMKLWRDEVIRTLAKEGHIAQAGAYTKYIEADSAASNTLHEKIQAHKARVLDSVWETFGAQFEVFSQGFNQLIQNKQLTVENVSALLLRSGSIKPSTLSPSVEKWNPSYGGDFFQKMREEAVLESSLKTMRAENREPHEHDITREEFLEFLGAQNSADAPRGDLLRLGSVGQRLKDSLQYLMDHSAHYRYPSEEEMWTDLLEMLWERRDSFAKHLHDGEPVNHYVEIAAKHALIDRYRRMKRQKDSGSGIPVVDEESVLDEILADVHERPDQSAIASESGIYLQNALKHLSFEEANLIHMHFWDQLSYHEIAEALGLNEGTVRYRILRAMENLKPWLPHEDWVTEEPFVSEVPEDEVRALDNALLSIKGIRGGKKHPEKTRRVQLTMQLYREGRDYAEITEATGVPDGTARRTIFRVKQLLTQKDPALTQTLLKLRSENGGQIQHRDENRHVEIHNGQLIRLGDRDDIRDLVAMFQREEDAYIHDLFGIGYEQHYGPDFLPVGGLRGQQPYRIFIYDPMGQLLEKRSIGSIFQGHERYDDLLKKPTAELQSPFEKEVGILQDLLQGFIRPFLEEMGLDDMMDQVHLSFEKDPDYEGYPLFHLHFKLLGLGPQLTQQDFHRVPQEDFEAFQKAFQFWYPYLFVHNHIDLSEQNNAVMRDENIARKYPAQRLSFYVAALEELGLASHVIYQTLGMLDSAFVAEQVAGFIHTAEADLRGAFPEHSPDFAPIAPRLRELKILEKYSSALVQILTAKYLNRREARDPEAAVSTVEVPRVTVYGGGDDQGPGSSSFLIEFGKTKILLDSGAGSRRRIEKNPPAHLDAILLSHAHNDHSGDLPWISEMFPDAPVYSSEATEETALLMMEDSYSFQTPQDKRAYKRNTAALKERFRALDPQVWYQITPELKIRLQPASHIPGANLIYIATPYRNYLYTGDFSGDAIRAATPMELLEDFPLDELWEESTYGSTVSTLSREDREQAFAKDLSAVIHRGGKVLIPTFAIGRTADVAATIRHLQSVQKVPDAPIYVDGLAAYNLEAYMRFLSESENGEDRKLYDLLEQGVTFVTDSIRADIKEGEMQGPFIILGGSGSLAGGRALQYFPSIASDPKNAVIIVGYQFPKTVGRDLKEGKREFKIDKVSLTVTAEVYIHDFGAHARQHSLIEVAEKTKPGITRLIHGELGAKESLRRLLEERGLRVEIPKTGDVVSAPEETAPSTLADRRAFFDGLNAVPAEDIKKKEKPPSFIYESLTEEAQYEVIGTLLVAFNLKSHDEEGHQIIRELIQKKRDEQAANPVTAAILETRALLLRELEKVPQRRKNAVRAEIWNRVRVSTGREPIAVPAEQPAPPKPGKRDPALVIAERRQRTLDEFSENIVNAFKGQDASEIPEAAFVREVVDHFLSQPAVRIHEKGITGTIPLLKPDGGLMSGNVARAIQSYMGPLGKKQEERWREAWTGLVRDFGQRRENRFSKKDVLLSAELLKKKGILAEDFTTLIYPGAGSFDAVLLSYFKRSLFSNLSEYHLNSLSYSASRGGSPEAGEQVKRELLRYLENPNNVTVSLSGTSYFAEDMAFDFKASGRRIWLHKLMGQWDRFGSHPELYTDTLLKGWVRPGDLIFVMSRGRHARNPFQWSQRAVEEMVKIPGMQGLSNDEYWHVYEVTEADVKNAREMTADRRENRTVLSLLLPSAEKMTRLSTVENLQQEARLRLEDLSARFDQWEAAVSAGPSENPALLIRRVFGDWTPYVDSTALEEILTASSPTEEETLARAKSFLNRPDLVQKHFSEFAQADTAALESGLLFALSSDPDEISEALRQAFQWTGIFYMKKSSLEKSVLEMVKADVSHFAAVPYGGEKSVRSRKLGKKGDAPLVWAPGNVLNYAGDRAREAQFKERGFQISQETLALLAAQKLTLKETLMLLKLFSVSDTLRQGLPRGEDGFLILTGEGMKAGLETLAELWSREAETARLTARAA